MTVRPCLILASSTIGNCDHHTDRGSTCEDEFIKHVMLIHNQQAHVDVVLATAIGVAEIVCR